MLVIKKVTFFTAIVLIILSLSACSENELKPDEPSHLMTLVKNSILHNDYSRFEDLVLDIRRDYITEEDFEEFHRISTPGSSEKIYHLQEFTNGEMIIVEVSPNKYDGEYKVLDVMAVPEEMKSFFKRE